MTPYTRVTGRSITGCGRLSWRRCCDATIRAMSWWCKCETQVLKAGVSVGILSAASLGCLQQKSQLPDGAVCQDVGVGSAPEQDQLSWFDVSLPMNSGGMPGGAGSLPLYRRNTDWVKTGTTLRFVINGALVGTVLAEYAWSEHEGTMGLLASVGRYGGHSETKVVGKLTHPELDRLNQCVSELRATCLREFEVSGDQPVLFDGVRVALESVVDGRYSRLARKSPQVDAHQRGLVSMNSCICDMLKFAVDTRHSGLARLCVGGG